MIHRGDATFTTLLLLNEKIYIEREIIKVTKMRKLIFIILFVLLLLIQTAIAEDQIVINSKNWQDVYSGMIYAKIKGVDVHYIVEETQGILLIKDVLDKNKKEVLNLESEDNPFIFGYKEKLEKEEFKVETLSGGEEENLQLARRIVEQQKIDSFIVIDDKLGYDAISVAPYASATKSFVLFANKDNIDEVFDFLSENAQQVLLYGGVDREVKEALKPLNPEVIETGDRYTDNIEIVKKFLDKRATKQIYLTNGEFIEPGLFNNEFPTLLIGTQNMPDGVVDFILESDVQVGVLIGYDLFDNAKNIKDLTGMKLYLKYAQGRNEQLYALDIYPLPKYNPNVEIKAVQYNTATKQLEVVYENTGDFFAYVQALSHDLKVNGDSIAKVGDKEAFFTDAGTATTRIYDVDLSNYLNEEIVAFSKVALGDSPASLTNLFTAENKVEIVSAEDYSEIKITDVVYNKGTKRFEVTVRNTGKENVFAAVDIVDIIITDKKRTIGSEQLEIRPGKSEVFKIKVQLEEIDIEDNRKVKVHAKYGSRKDVLIKSLLQEFDLAIKSIDYKPIVAIAIIIIILWQFFAIKKKRKAKSGPSH